MWFRMNGNNTFAQYSSISDVDKILAKLKLKCWKDTYVYVGMLSVKLMNISVLFLFFFFRLFLC